MKLKQFQRADLARAALHDGLILGWAPGLGKGLAMYLWPLLKCGLLQKNGHPAWPLCPAAPVLIVATGDLHEQITKEGLKHFGIEPIALDSQERFTRLSRIGPGASRVLHPGMYLTSYSQLSRNGVETPQEPDFIVYEKNLGKSKYYPRLDRSVRCIHSPSLADLCQDAFECVVLDEGVRIKGEDTLMGVGTRLLNPRYRLILTATPIKNRMHDIFHLAHWVTGGKHLRHEGFPYAASEQQRFARDFGVLERNLSAEKRSGRKVIRLTPRIGSVHKAWKVLAPIVLRRRKKDCGEELVNKAHHVVRVPFGKAQAMDYSYHLRRPGDIGAKLQALRRGAC